MSTIYFHDIEGIKHSEIICALQIMFVTTVISVMVMIIIIIILVKTIMITMVNM